MILRHLVVLDAMVAVLIGRFRTGEGAMRSEEDKMELRSGRLAVSALIMGCVALGGWAYLVGWATVNCLVP